MPQSYVQYPANGTNRGFAVPFLYINKAHVRAKVDGVPVTFTWPNDSFIQLDAAPAAGTVVEVRRTTPNDARLVDFVDGSTLTESDLDQSNQQFLFLAQEAQDRADEAPRLTAKNTYDFQGRRATNLADPVAAQDAVTKTWVETDVNSSVVRSRANAEEAGNKATQAGTSASNAAASATAAKAAQTAAENAAANPDLSKALVKAQNLADVVDKETARGNLGLKGAATREAGVTGGVALYDDPRFGSATAQGPWVNLSSFNPDPSGIASSDAALNAAIASLPPAGGVIVIGIGRFKFDTKKEYNLTGSITLQGSAQSATVLVWPTATDGGLKFNYTTNRAELRVFDLTVATGVAGGGEGICLQQTPANQGREGFTANIQNVFGRVTTRGDTSEKFTNKWWTKGIACHGVSFVNFHDILCGGGAPGGEGSRVRKGIGVSLEGAGFGGTQSYGVLYNFVNGQMTCCDIGLYYGSYIQGVSMTNWNVVYSRAGIATIAQADNPQGSDLAQIYLTNWQYGLGEGNGIELLAVTFTLSMTNCTVFTKSNNYGLYMPFCVPFKITGGTFQGEAYDLPAGTPFPPGSIGVYIGTSAIEGGSILGSDFSSLSTGIRCGGARITGNSLQFNNCPNTIVDTGTRNMWGTEMSSYGFVAGVTGGVLPPAAIPPNQSGTTSGSRALQFVGLNGGTKTFTNIATDPLGNLLINATSESGVPKTALVKCTGNLECTGLMTVGTNLAVSGSTSVKILNAEATDINGNLTVRGGVGFYGSNPIAKPVISGQLTNNEDMLARIINALVALGLVTNSTTY